MQDSVWWWAMAALLIFGSCKPIAREEPASNEQSARLYRMFDVLVTKGDVKNARIIFRNKLYQSDLEAMSQLIANMMRRGKAEEVITFFGSWVTESIREADEILVKISASKSAREVEELLGDFDKQVGPVKRAFAEQRKAIVAITTGKYRVFALDNYLRAIRQGDEGVPWLDYDSWTANVQRRLTDILSRKTGLPDTPPLAEKTLSDRIKQAWEALKTKLTPVPAN